MNQSSTIVTSAPATAQPPAECVDLNALLADSNVTEVLDELDAELIGLKPVKARIRDIAALLLVERARKQVGLAGGSPSGYSCFFDMSRPSAPDRKTMSPATTYSAHGIWSPP